MCKSNNLDGAKKLFDSLPSKNLKRDTMIFTIMLSGLLTVGLLQESEDLFARMLDKGPTPNEITYNIMFRGLLQNKKIDKAVQLRNEMVKRDFSLDANSISIIVDLHASDGPDWNI
ncbi:hypothetical protein GIB67_036003 [Kingdonia uniflora]|uniref:Pentatricopeptide repeat-containing protein n=1 Tax=Kingdonia uniflora TaxID=39325 RepID=A0A7J7N1B6_9MAGN|nr:hypothetical protein GIB67_036003 [Kingdonia uniflora]